jgi:hypothetical protein
MVTPGRRITHRRLCPIGLSVLVRQVFEVLFFSHSDHLADWLRERVFFEALKKSDQYVIGRLGFRAPNIFLMDLAT